MSSLCTRTFSDSSPSYFSVFILGLFFFYQFMWILKIFLRIYNLISITYCMRARLKTYTFSSSKLPVRLHWAKSQKTVKAISLSDLKEYHPWGRWCCYANVLTSTPKADKGLLTKASQNGELVHYHIERLDSFLSEVLLCFFRKFVLNPSLSKSVLSLPRQPYGHCG